MRLLKEVTETVNLIQESATDPGKKDYYIEGIYMMGEVQNKNGRVYPSEVLDPEVERYIEEYVSKNRAFGELGHPDNPSINLDRVSHLIVELKKDGANWRGKAKIIDTPCGKIVKSIIEAGGKLGVSSRALGSLKSESGTNIVQNDLKIMTAADIVADPSAPEAFVEAIMEDKEWLLDANGDWQPVAESYRKRIREANLNALKEEKIRIFKDFLSRL